MLVRTSEPLLPNQIKERPPDPPPPLLLCWERSRDDKDNKMIQGVPVEHLSKVGED